MQQAADSAIPYWQYIALMAVAIPSSLASILSSCLLLRLSLSKLQTSIYHRTLCVLSLCDVGFSLGNLLQVVMAPFDSTIGNYWAMGNDTWTCSLVACLYASCALAVPVMNCVLALSFYVSIAKSWFDATFTRRIEFPMHLFSLVVSVSLPTTAWIYDKMVFQKVAMVCVPARGLFFSIVPGIVVSLFALGSIAATLATNHYVKGRLRRSQTYLFDGASNTASERTLREANVQSILYCLVFLNSFVWIVVIAILGNELDYFGNEHILKRFFLVRLAMYFFVPLQGVLNFAVYMRPRTLRWKRSSPERSWVWAIRHAATRGDLPPPVVARDEAAERDRDPKRNNHFSPEDEEDGGQEISSTEEVSEDLRSEFDCGTHQSRSSPLTENTR